jgi:hypothetical protein
MNTTFHNLDKSLQLRRPKNIEEYAMACGCLDSGLGYLQDQWVTLSSGLDEGELLAGYTYHIEDRFDPLRGTPVQNPVMWAHQDGNIAVLQQEN